MQGRHITSLLFVADINQITLKDMFLHDMIYITHTHGLY